MNLIYFLFIICMTLTSVSFGEILEGSAKSIEGSFQYIEIHSVDRAPDGTTKKIETTYLNPQNKKIAFLRSEFKKNQFMPDTTFEDYRHKVKYEGSMKGEIEYQIKATDKSGNIKTKVIPADKTMIMGQGFDNFIRRGLLEKNISSMIVNFLVLFRKDFFEFEIKRLSSAGSPQEHFKIRPVSFLIRVFAKEIDLFYAPKSLTLQKYIGLSNIANDSNDHPMVEISYKQLESLPAVLEGTKQ